MTSTNAALPAFITPGAIVAKDTADGPIVNRVSYARAGDHVTLITGDGMRRIVEETMHGRLLDRLAGYRPASTDEAARFEQMSSRYGW